MPTMPIIELKQVLSEGPVIECFFITDLISILARWARSSADNAAVARSFTTMRQQELAPQRIRVLVIPPSFARIPARLLGGFAEGSNPWDVNVNGGQLFESGTATIGSVMGVVKDSTKHWMPGRWEGYSITDLDAPHPFNGSVITANTSTTITYKRNDEPDVPGGQWHNIRPGHRYEIHKMTSLLIRAEWAKVI